MKTSLEITFLALVIGSALGIGALAQAPAPTAPTVPGATQPGPINPTNPSSTIPGITKPSTPALATPAPTPTMTPRATPNLTVPRPVFPRR